VNLLENALRIAPDDVAISVQATVGDDGRLEVRVVDRGPGIPPEHRAQAFDEFVRIGARRGDGGVGLGLAIVRGFVAANDGRVWYEETPGGGATFALALPVEAVEVIA